MKIRRCKVLYLEPRETVAFSLESLLEGGAGLVRERDWLALAPHLDRPVPVTPSQIELLGKLGTEEWVALASLQEAESLVAGELLDTGLVVSSAAKGRVLREQDQRLRDTHWHPLAATYHRFTRWGEADAVEAMDNTGTETAQALRDVLGTPPPAVGGPRHEAPIALSRSQPDQFDELLERRITCRNFDESKPLPMSLLAHLVERVFAAHGQLDVTSDLSFLKKTSPSGGGLHPVEAYLLVRNVEGLAPGLYYYHPVDHALHPMPMTSDPDEFALRMVAGQDWFSSAHAMAILAPRYERSFWKYRQHAKAYRAIVLEAGHLSQTLYLSATALGLGAYVTAAINEEPLDELLGLDVIRAGALAVCGFGWRADRMVTMELDPQATIWSDD